jgi:predicted GNAT family N-acyltransferase
MQLSFRQYVAQDFSSCVSIFCSNIPHFFREHERADFESFISASECPYFVIEQDGGIVGCGGYGVHEGSRMADLCWGMIDSGYHGKRLGEYLLLIRLNEIVQLRDVRGVRLGTSQHTDGFFQRYGFAVQSRQHNGIAEGLDEVEMLLELTEGTRQKITEYLRRLSDLDLQVGRGPASSIES